VLANSSQPIMNSTQRFASLVALAVAMASIEAVVVVYLRDPVPHESHRQDRPSFLRLFVAYPNAIRSSPRRAQPWFAVL
jgi:hypothetical protein